MRDLVGKARKHKLNQTQAQSLANFIADVEGFPKWPIIYTYYETRRVMANFWIEREYIRVNVGGENAATICHEMAHHSLARADDGLYWNRFHDGRFHSQYHRNLEIYKEWEELEEIAPVSPNPTPPRWKDFEARGRMENTGFGDGRPFEISASQSLYEEEGDEEDIILEVVEELVDNSKVAVSTVSMLHLGEVLSREGINTTKNIKTVRELLKEEGVRVVAGDYIQ